MIGSTTRQGAWLFALAAIMAGGLAFAIRQIQVEPDPALVEASLQAAYRYADHMALNSARNAVRRARSLSDDHAPARRAEALIEVLEALRRSGDEAALKKLADGRSNEASVQIALGRYALARGSDKKALGHFRRAVDLEGDNAAAHLELGKAQIRVDEIAEGLRHLAIAYENRGKFYYVAWEYAKALLERDRTADAVEVLDGLADVGQIHLEYTLQYLLAAAPMACQDGYARRIREARSYFDNDLTMSLGENDETWELVVDNQRVVLNDRQAKRDRLADLQTALKNRRCGE